MTRKRFVVMAVLTLTGTSVLGQTKDQSTDPLIGTWKLSVAKSKFTPGPGPKSQTLKWEPTPTGFNFTIDTVNAQGQSTQSQARGTVDGKEYMAKTSTLTLMRTTRRVDANTYEETDRVDGKLRTSRRAVISMDGKTMTVTAKGTNAQGQPTNNIAVYERQ